MLRNCCRALVFAFWLLGFSPFASAVAATPNSPDEPVLARLMLHDFERSDGTSNPGHGHEQLAFAGHLGRPDQVSPEAAQRQPNGGRALHLDYRFAPDATMDIGWQIRLPDLDASAYDHLEFWIRGDAHAGYAEALKVEFKQPLAGAPPGLLRQGSYIVTGITGDWQRIRVPLNRMNGIADWRHLRQLGIVLQPRRVRAIAGAYWLDDIALVKTGQPGPSIRDPLIPPRKAAWENRLGGKMAAQPAIRARLAGWLERLLVNTVELPSDDQAFLWRLARDTWRGLAALSDYEHGLPFDTVRFDTSGVADRAWLGDYTNVTNIGLYLLDIVAARELGLIRADEALARLDRPCTRWSNSKPTGDFSTTITTPPRWSAPAISCRSWIRVG
ncbi:MAG: hypothetical protein U1F42_06140 [Candidatus Competibacteraceae bacterium]